MNVNGRITRWLLLAAGAVMAYNAHRAVQANEVIISVQAILVGMLALFAWGILFRDRSPKRAYSEGGDDA